MLHGLSGGEQGGERGQAPGNVGDRRAVHAQPGLEDGDQRCVGQAEHQRHAGDQDRHLHLRGVGKRQAEEAAEPEAQESGKAADEESAAGEDGEAADGGETPRGEQQPA